MMGFAALTEVFDKDGLTARHTIGIAFDRENSTVPKYENSIVSKGIAQRALSVER